MRLIKLGLYILAILVLQTVILSRGQILGAAPDLVLVSVIIFSILVEGPSAYWFAGAAGLLQDALCFGPYLNVITKVLVAVLLQFAKDRFLGGIDAFALGAVALLTPVTMLLEAGWRSLFYQAQFGAGNLFTLVILTTILNVSAAVALLPALKRLAHD